MIAFLFQPQFAQPILDGVKTETRRLPCCKLCQKHALEILPQVFNDGPKLRCLCCGAHNDPKWRMTPGKSVMAVTRPLFAVPPLCPEDEAHGRTVRTRGSDKLVTGYWCETCGAHVPARFALLDPLERRLERLDAITEEGARADGLCGRAEFMDLVLRLSDASYYRPRGELETRETPTSVAVEVYRFRCLGP